MIRSSDPVLIDEEVVEKFLNAAPGMLLSRFIAVWAKGVFSASPGKKICVDAVYQFGLRFDSPRFHICYGNC